MPSICGNGVRQILARQGVFETLENQEAQAGSAGEIRVRQATPSSKTRIGQLIASS